MEIEELRQIPLKEIAKKTQLDEHNIKAILDKDFEKLANVNVYMNLKILQREFNVDFTDFKQEYESHRVDTNNHKLKIQPVLLHYNNSNSRSSSGFISYFILLVFLCVVAVGIYYFIENQNQNYEKTQENISISNVSKEDSVEENKEELKNQIEETENNLSEEAIKKNDEKINSQEQNQQNKEENTQSVNETQNTNQTQENLAQKIDDEEKKENANITEELAENKSEIQGEKQEEKQEEKKVEVTTQDNVLVIIPHQKIWMSIKDLNEKINKNYLLEKKIELNTNSLIFLGKNNYDLYLNQNKIEIPANKDGRYLIFKDNKVEFLTRVEFNKIDKMSK